MYQVRIPVSLKRRGQLLFEQAQPLVFQIWLQLFYPRVSWLFLSIYVPFISTTGKPKPHAYTTRPRTLAYLNIP